MKKKLTGKKLILLILDLGLLFLNEIYEEKLFHKMTIDIRDHRYRYHEHTKSFFMVSNSSSYTIFSSIF